MIFDILKEYWFVIILWSVVVIAWYLGALTSVEPYEADFPGGTFYYFNIQTSTKKIGKLLFTQIDGDIKKYVSTLPKKVSYPLAAIFYDDPGDLVDDNTMRVSAGFIVRVKNDSVNDYFTKLGYEVK